MARLFDSRIFSLKTDIIKNDDIVSAKSTLPDKFDLIMLIKKTNKEWNLMR